MKGRTGRVAWVLAALLMTGCAAGAGMSSDPPRTPDPEAAQVEIGKRIYREGIGSDGQPIEALVMGDIPVFGDQFTCLHCHRYSGLGGAEGTKYVMPTSGPTLYTPRVGIYHERPAYTDATLAEVLRHGLDPGGNLLDPAMPVYDLSETDMQALIAYLKTLSSRFSPGVDDEKLHVATVVGPGVSEGDRHAMLDVLERFFADTNGQSRRQEMLVERGPFYHEYKNKAYREWQLHVWELRGEPQDWEAQLAEYYRRQPVFALVSGVTADSWQPIHEFARREGIPALLPNTDLPGFGADDDFYALYFSGGLALEAQAVLADVARKRGALLVQAYLESPRGRYGAEALRRAQHDYPGIDLVTRSADDPDALEQILAGLPAGAALLLWADRPALEGVAGLLAQRPDLQLYLSSTLLGRELSAVPEGLPATLAHPFNLPEDQAFRERRTTAWIRGKQIPLTNVRIQTQTWYACKVFHSGIKHIKRHFYRDYLLDALDHSSRLGPYSSNFPRLSFGPDQRYLAKGAYLVEAGARDPAGKTVARWVVP